MNSSPAKTPFLISTSLVALGIRSERSIARHERWYILFALPYPNAELDMNI